MQNLRDMIVVSFESRRAGELAVQLERAGAMVVSAPALREVPALRPETVAGLAADLAAGRVDMIVLLTGSGAQTLMAALADALPGGDLRNALARTKLIVRGDKPRAALEALGLPIAQVSPEPHTCGALLTELEAQGSLAGRRVVVQDCGNSGRQLAEALRDRGAEPVLVRVYDWAPPEDRGTLECAVRTLAAGSADVMVFTSAPQVGNVLAVAGELGLEGDFRRAARRTLIASVGPACSAALREAGLGADLEPDRPRMDDLVRELARCAPQLLARKRASDEAGIDPTRARRVDLVWPVDRQRTAADRLHDSAFMRACRREPADYTPIWLMRQAGRYQRAYREIREKLSFLEMCKRPDVAAEVTLLAVDQLGVDAAIIFADILLILEPMGVGLAFNRGEGPAIARPVRGPADIDRLIRTDPAESLGFVMEAVRLTRRALRPDIPLIGFAGAPFTVASYLIEGGASRNFIETKSFMYRDPGAWAALMDVLVEAHARYLNAQIEAGAQAVQLFDSWVGCLNEADYRKFVLPHSRAVIEAVRPGVPVLHFGANTAVLLGAMREAGGQVIGVDWRIGLAEAWSRVGHDVAVQGNLDPVALFATPLEIRRQARMILEQAAGRPGHIFNVGHGILPGTPVEHVQLLVDFVHEYRNG